MISFEDAQQKILSLPLSLKTEFRPLSQCFGSYLAQTLKAAHPLPHWNNSAMDGYAFAWSDLENGQAEFSISMIIAAGDTQHTILPKGTAARIMTGAPLPKGADTVIMQENTDKPSEKVVRFNKAPNKGKGANVRIAGEESQVGNVFMKKGTRLGGAALGLCASLGYSKLEVFTPPKIGILGTGDELRTIGEPLRFGEIWSSNTISIQMELQQLGFSSKDYGIARDSLASTKEVFGTALEECDVIISTGGVSVGDFDFVKEALSEFKLDMSFWKVAMKPGKPIAYGTFHGKPLFALPGNPVSCLMSFYQFVRPFLLQTVNYPKPFLPKIQAKLIDPITSKGSRLDFRRMILEERDGEVWTRETGSQSSAWLTSLVKADALFPIQPEISVLPSGSIVTLQLLL
jgi:molybdopterin molybdotransferase